ncbi:DUF2280 domain-containing protein [Dongia sedimenti]|uniref:DUF2280 domain-containing protein n=1 Tax=Dongia sedimenti TaxID=3064282 RepID=A0ABU0YNE3_9PROT|nr:DUF2280 domain-containing protein [Rhodospirillaceae bacterium R-7]
MPHLTDEIKTFIVKGLACYDTPSQVAEAVRVEFDIVVSRQQVHEYDPACARPPAQRWRDLHAATRAALLRELGEIGIAHRAVRLRRLDRLASRSERNNVTTALKCIEMAAKECGGMYENRKPIVLQPSLPQSATPTPPALQPAAPQPAMPQPAAIQQPSSPKRPTPKAAAPRPRPQPTTLESTAIAPTVLRPAPPPQPAPFLSVPLPVMPQPDKPASSAPQPLAVLAQTPASPASPPSPPLSRVERYLAYVADRHARDRAVAAQARLDSAGTPTLHVPSQCESL